VRSIAMLPCIGGLVLAMTLLAVPARADVYVATTGDDANPGTQAKPLQSLDAARAMVRQQRKQQPHQATTVWIAGGAYYLAKSFVLKADDSGDEGSPIVYRAAVGQQVRLVGGRRIPPEAFLKLTARDVLDRLEASARGNVLQADLKALGVTDFGEVPPNGRGAELFFNDRPLVLARWPNEGFTKIADVTGEQPIDSHGIKGSKVGKFIYHGDRPARWTTENDLWLQGYWFWDWSDQYQHVASINTPSRTITLKPPYHTYGYRKGMRFYAVNALAELDSPGEWYLDRTNGRLYLWPPEAMAAGLTTFPGGQIVVGTLRVRSDGTRSVPTTLPRDIAAPMANANIVFSIVETPLVLLENVSYVTLRDLTIEATRGTGIEIRGGQNDLVAGCTIRNTGGCGAIIGGGRNHAIRGCDIYQTGAGGIRLSGGDRKTLAPAGNAAVNNHIHHYARLRRTYAAAIQLDGVGNLAAHNLIHDAPHMAIGFGGNENVMELNEIHDVCQETGDVGVFYTGRDWTVRGNVIRHNYIHDVSGPGLYGAQGVYLDDAASGTLVFGNFICKTARAMLLGGGRDNVVENNLMVHCGESIDFDNRGLNWMKETVTAPGGLMPKRLMEMPFRQPPWSERYPQLLTVLDDQPAAPKHNTLRNNVVCRCKPMQLAKEVAQYGTVADNLTLVDDAELVDAAKGDFRLRSDSSVYRKLPQFLPIPLESIGLQVDEYRREKLPK
jgi:hypothetical protein